MQTTNEGYLVLRNALARFDHMDRVVTYTGRKLPGEAWQAIAARLTNIDMRLSLQGDKRTKVRDRIALAMTRA